jgi:[glutamine synthetase] adenylyltransferase / [glutamine synthetase]-adenylyl-L-tyrosine phosphorylase
VTCALTKLADSALQSCLNHLFTVEVARGRMPGVSIDNLHDLGGYFVLAMGKMGAFELNYSSDIDLICLFDEGRYPAEDLAEIRAGFVRITKGMVKAMSEVTSEGYVFRTDLRLRPNPSVTPICIGTEHAEHYYESLGRTWERAAYIKARACAGDIASGERFLAGLRPFVWRRHLDFAAIQDAHDMRLRIREHKGIFAEPEVPGLNLKLAPGGIRVFRPDAADDLWWTRCRFAAARHHGRTSGVK